MRIFRTKEWNTEIPPVSSTQLSPVLPLCKQYSEREEERTKMIKISESLTSIETEMRSNLIFWFSKFCYWQFVGAKDQVNKNFTIILKLIALKKSINQPYELSTYSQLWNRIAAPDWLLSFYCYFFIVPFEFTFLRKKQISRKFKYPLNREN